MLLTPFPQDALAKIRAVGFNVGHHAGIKGTAKTLANLHVIARAYMDVVCLGKQMAWPEVAPIASPVIAPPVVSCYLCERRCKLFAIRHSPCYPHEAKVRTYVEKMFPRYLQPYESKSEQFITTAVDEFIEKYWEGRREGRHGLRQEA